jgi:Protein of unknown function (DUF4054)
MVTYQSFIADYPEFSNAMIFPQSGFNYWANFAMIMLTSVWGQAAPAGQPNSLFDIGEELFIAHNLVLEAMNQKSVAVGGIPGLTKGVVSAENAGQVSVSYDTTAGIEEDAGQWNLTTYGIRLIGIARMLGAQPTQIGPQGIGGPPFSGPGWIGPPPFPGYFSS